jgi:hypothetical protein
MNFLADFQVKRKRQEDYCRIIEMKKLLNKKTRYGLKYLKENFFFFFFFFFKVAKYNCENLLV